MDNVNKYPYLVNNEDNQNLLKKKDKCDKYDYITAIACGAIGGYDRYILSRSSWR